MVIFPLDNTEDDAIDVEDCTDGTEIASTTMSDPAISSSKSELSLGIGIRYITENARKTYNTFYSQ